MTEDQKRIGSLSNVSRESQGTAGSAPLRSTPCALSSLAGGLQDAAAHAESSVVFPLPAEAETSVNGYARTASSSLSKRSRSTSEIGRRGGESLAESSTPFCSSASAVGS